MADENQNSPVEPVADTTPVAATESALGPEVKSEAPAEVKTEEKPSEETSVEVKTEEAPSEEKAPEAKADEKAVEVKPEEKPAESKAEEKPAETKTEETPVEIKPFDAFTLPEGVKMEDAQSKEIHSMLGAFETALRTPNADYHGEVQKFGQAMVEYGLGIVQDAIAKTRDESNKYWADKTKEWRQAYESDPEIGGNRKDTTTKAARDFISLHAGSPEKANTIRQLLYDHKLADHPEMIRLFANANLARVEAKPLPAQKPAPSARGKLDRWYGNMQT